MSRALEARMLQALGEGVVHPFFTVDLDFASGTVDYGGETVQSAPLYLWTGLGSIDIEGTTYAGTGQLLEIDTVEETTEVAARAASISLSGVPSSLLALALQTQYQGRKCIVQFGVYTFGDVLREDGFYVLKEDDGHLSLESSTKSRSLIFSGYMDQMTIAEGAETSAISLSVESRLIDLERIRTRRYTAEDQKRRHPADQGFDFVNSIQDQELFWGRR